MNNGRVELALQPVCADCARHMSRVRAAHSTPVLATCCGTGCSATDGDLGAGSVETQMKQRTRTGVGAKRRWAGGFIGNTRSGSVSG